ncbi:MAG: glucuronate isomerase [Alistipes sp.]|jgi:glucuronate isomerase|nr:glucuronate isomerase [Alistipes sp.]
MKEFMDRDFVLETDTARSLYHNHAARLPIIDYHCHLDPAMIARDHRFDNLGEAWLAGDHYKWRALRANGVDERYITGRDTSDWEKFEKWAATVPYTMRNPLYHWTHLELRTAFGVQKLLGPDTAREIYDQCTALLRTPEYSARGLMRRYNVEAVCTTDDPADSLEHHASLRREGFEVKVLPTWRPDRAMAVEDPAAFRAYVERLGAAAGVSIGSFAGLLEALGRRHDFFHEQGCRLSDHGTGGFHAADFTDAAAGAIFNKAMGGRQLTGDEIEAFKSAMMYHGALMDHSKGWVQQFHYGPLRNNNSRMMRLIGPDTGYDSIGDFTVGGSMSRFFDRLDNDDRLAKTIVYNLNPRDNALVATMIGNFQGGGVAGKMQMGSGWWFMDQRTGMEDQLNTLSNLGLLSRFVGMLTDSRSFLSYPRHEYFRRIVCNLLGGDVERGVLPASELPFIGQLVEGVSYRNAKSYFGF